MQDCFYFTFESPEFVKPLWESHSLQSARVFELWYFFELRYSVVLELPD